MAAAHLELIALPGLPTIREGDDLARLIVDAAALGGLQLDDRDVLAVAQKIVSKAEGRAIDLRQVVPSEMARLLAARTGLDARLIEAILAEGEVLRSRPHLVIARHRLGLVLASAGIDRSNVESEEDGERALRLPLDPDASAARLRARLRELTGVAPAVVVTDTFGRPFRLGAVGTAIGAAGLPALLDLRGRVDRNGRTLQATEIGLADEIAAAASLLMGQADEGQPVVLLRGLELPPATPAPAAALVRPPADDLFG
jgi:coenzyme F420-0:L-glutamate ligase/coenzyme F420-1:gamma-L-glutamate ligase